MARSLQVYRRLQCTLYFLVIWHRGRFEVLLDPIQQAFIGVGCMGVRKLVDLARNAEVLIDSVNLGEVKRNLGY